ncbi:MMPL family transporter [Streptacidiphilus sp. P02-A3a]|uniref:MMPL family transporter n=1 Tax=Streptacidiphilus sp. P02-A3a TaxID=2704468 RepID=UPI0015FA2E4F|nr:MMPL family transporter [Streptacidiphilus sp. P02-A3a]QMU67050.1 MMPL family transporter [Streptacidiphilus sp. P02-A3a]
MATVLYRLGHLSFRHRICVLAAWLAAIAAVVCCALTVGGAGKLDDTFTIPGSQSQQALDRMRQDFPAAAGTSAQIVFTAPAGHRLTEPAEQAAIRTALADARQAPQVAAVISPSTSHAISPDHSTAIAQVQYRVKADALASDSLDRLSASVRGARNAGLDVQVGGAAYNGAKAQPGAGDLIGVAVAVVVLALTFGSLLTAGMPLLSALIGVAVGLGGVLALTGAATISSTALTLALMIALAVGIDYALFIVTRHRSQLAEGMDPAESAARAVGTAGSAVVFAGLTVVIAMAGLSVVGIPFLTVMGLCAAGSVLVAVAVAVTLLPALLGFAGRRLAPRPGSRTARREHAIATAGPDRPANLGERWIRIAVRRPLVTVLLVVAALGALAWPATSMTLALPDNGTAPAGSSQRVAYDEITRAFGPGFNGPLLVLADTGHSADPAAAVAGVDAEIRAMPDVAAVATAGSNPVTRTALIQVVPRSGPSDQATKNLVNRIRDDAGSIQRSTGASVAVTGDTAVGIDVSAKLSAALLPFAGVVVGLSLVLLLLVFRSLVVPVKAAAGFLLSVAATFGAVVGVFQWGHLGGLVGVDQSGPIASFLPIIVMAVLFGLAMDYEVFLVSRMRESYVRTGHPLTAVHAGARHAARVVTAAAVIMFSVFAAFVSSPSMILKQIAFSLAVGILIDAFVVRMTFVPAVLALAGRWSWWLPGWLDRLLPGLDIEGERLHRAEPEERPSDRAAALN